MNIYHFYKALRERLTPASKIDFSFLGRPFKAFITVLVISTLPESYATEARIYMEEELKGNDFTSIFDYFLGGISYRATALAATLLSIWSRNSGETVK